MITEHMPPTDIAITAPTGEVIKRAEQDISAGRYLLALGLLAEALRREPANVYLRAIVERVEQSIRESLKPDVPRESDQDVVEEDLQTRMRAAASTSDFGAGTGLLEEAAVDGADNASRVKLLTIVATNLYERGAYDQAIQSLMKAHLLDPDNPRVMECERTIRPALEELRRRTTAPLVPRTPKPTEDLVPVMDLSKYLEHTGGSVRHEHLDTPSRIEQLRAEAADVVAPEEQRRVQALQARQALERRKRELLLWGRASGSIPPPDRLPHPLPRLPKSESPTGALRERILARLRRNRPGR